MTFQQLRQQKNRIAKDLKGAINLLKLSREENTRLKKSNQTKDITIASLEIKEKELSDKIYSLYNKVDERTKLSYDNYQAWLDEVEINSQLIIGLTIASIVIFGLVATLIGVLK